LDVGAEVVADQFERTHGILVYCNYNNI